MVSCGHDEAKMSRCLRRGRHYGLFLCSLFSNGIITISLEKAILDGPMQPRWGQNEQVLSRGMASWPFSLVICSAVGSSQIGQMAGSLSMVWVFFWDRGVGMVGGLLLLVLALAFLLFTMPAMSSDVLVT